MSNPRKDFDVKQILRIRWRWFGHPTSPPSPGNQPSGDLFSNSGGSGNSSRGNGGASSGGDQPSLGGCSSSNAAAGASSSNGNLSSNINNSRKFGDSGPNSGHSAAAVVISGTACPRSMSQQECRSSPPAPWVFPVHSRSSESLEPLQQQPQQPQQQQQPQKQQYTRAPDASGPGDEENNNNVESDSSSCRYGSVFVTGVVPCEHSRALVPNWYHSTTDALPAVLYYDKTMFPRSLPFVSLHCIINNDCGTFKYTDYIYTNIIHCNHSNVIYFFFNYNFIL